MVKVFGILWVQLLYLRMHILGQTGVKQGRMFSGAQGSLSQFGVINRFYYCFLFY